MRHTTENNAAVPYLILKQCRGRMASAISEGGWRRVRFSRVRTETPLAGRMLALFGGEGGKLEGRETGRRDGARAQESRTRDEKRNRGRERERERERVGKGGRRAVCMHGCVRVRERA